MASTTSASTTVTTPAVITSFPVVPLTTTFTPPADCSGFYAPSNGINMVDPMTSCLPPGAKSASTAYFSPGIVCPSGYVEACHDTRGVSTITTATCCPVRGNIALSCVDTSTLNGPFASLFCSWIPTSTTSLSFTLSSNDGTTSTALITVASPGGLNAYGVRMVYQSSDLPGSSSSATPKSNSATTTATSSTSSTSTTQTSSSMPASKGTSGGTIAAAVVVPIVVLALLGGLYFWWRNRRQTRKEYTGHELSSEVPKWYNNRSELPSEAVRGAELGGGMQKLEGFRQPVELPVDGRG